MPIPQLLASAEFRYIARGWRDEIPSPVGILEKPYIELRQWEDRMLDEKYILWVGAWDRLADGSFVPRVDHAGKRVMEHHVPRGEDAPDDWIFPVHEAVKRRKGRGDRPALEYRWLVAILRDTGGPCLCAHRNVVHHLADRYRVTEHQVVGAVLRACRAAVRDVRPHDYSAPPETSVLVSDTTFRRQRDSTWKRRRGRKNTDKRPSRGATADGPARAIAIPKAN